MPSTASQRFSVLGISAASGKVELEPVSFGVGRGWIAGTAALDGRLLGGEVMREPFAKCYAQDRTT